MSAPAGNINAEKWTLGNTEWLLHEIENIVDDPSVLLLSQALVMSNAYSKLWWRLKRKFCLHEDIIHRMEVIEEKFEVKMLHGVLVGRFKEKAARMVIERSSRIAYRESKEEIISGVPDEMIDAVEAKIGKLDDDVRNDPQRRKVIARVYGKNMAQLIEEGFHIYEGSIYAPEEPGYMDKDDEWVPCIYADDDECDECRAAA